MSMLLYTHKKICQNSAQQIDSRYSTHFSGNAACDDNVSLLPVYHVRQNGFSQGNGAQQIPFPQCLVDGQFRVHYPCSLRSPRIQYNHVDL